MAKVGSDREAAVLQLVLPRLKDQGYEVFFQPSRDLLPTFMQGYRPDAIAVKPGRNLAIEVKTSATRPIERSQLERIRALFDGQADWELQVYYAPSTDQDAESEPQSNAVISDALDRLVPLYDQAGPIPAILTGWAVFEAAARRLMPSDLRKPQSTSGLIEALASAGGVTPDEARLLRRLGQLRNQAAHGKLDIDLTRSDLDALITVTRNILTLVVPVGAA